MPMIIGHQKQWQFLIKSTEMGRISHAYLFSGPEKLGKKKIALEWISKLFGYPSAKILQGNHPDFILIEPNQNYSEREKSLLRRKVQIGQIKELNFRLSLKPSSAPLKAVIIDQAHMMNTEAQNCFLKTLEDPPGQTLLILITEHPEILLPTIRSRTEIIKFFPVAKKEIENYLKENKIEENEAKLISQISQGKPGVAIEFLKNPQKIKEKEILLEEIERLTKTNLVSRFQYAKKISQSSQLREILNLWLFYFRESLISSLNSKVNSKVVNSKVEPWNSVNSKVESWKIGKLAKILEKIQEILYLISFTNVNPRLVLEILMLEL